VYTSPKPCLARIRDDIAGLERAIELVANETIGADFNGDVKALEAAIGKLLAGIELLKCSRPLNLSPAGIQAAKVAGLTKVYKHLAVAEPGDRGYGQPGYATATATDADRSRMRPALPSATALGRLARRDDHAAYAVTVFGAAFATGEGRWSAVINVPGQEAPERTRGQEMSSDRDRMLMKAAVSALRRIPPKSLVVISTDSASLVHGAERVLSALVLNQRFPKNRQIKNPDLWRDLAVAVAGLNVTWERVPVVHRESEELASLSTS
jgi:ribonuclease HI